MEGKRKMKCEGTHSPFTQTRSTVNTVKIKWRATSPGFITPFPGGCKNAIAGRDLEDGPLQSPHVTSEENEALEGQVTYKVRTGSQVHCGTV